MSRKNLPEGYEPTKQQVEYYLVKWQGLENYVNQEHALDKLFGILCPKNDNIEDILIKCSTLNDFYSTNIFDIHAMSKHILSLNIDNRLEAGDPSLVNEIAHANVGKGVKPHFFYSFATKYCSHHQPMKYAIYDNFVEKVLKEMQRRDKFASFKTEDLKNYPIYVRIIRDFQKHYGLTEYNLKQMDQYLWQLGKDYYSPYLKK